MSTAEPLATKDMQSLTVPIGSPDCECNLMIFESIDGRVLLGFDLKAFDERLSTSPLSDKGTSVASVRDGFIDGLNFAHDWFGEQRDLHSNRREVAAAKFIGSAQKKIAQKLAEVRETMPAEAEPLPSIDPETPIVEQVAESPESVGPSETIVADPSPEATSAPADPQPVEELPLTDAERLAEIDAAMDRVNESEAHMEACRRKHKAAKEDWEDAVADLMKLRKPNKPLPLFDQKPGAKADKPTDAAPQEPPVDESWKSVSVEVLRYEGKPLGKRIATAFENIDVKTLGDLVAKQANPFWAKDTKGIGGESLTKIEKALEDWLAANSPAHKAAAEAARANAKEFTIDDAMQSIGYRLEMYPDSGLASVIDIETERVALDHANVAQQWDFFHSIKGGGIGDKTPDPAAPDDRETVLTPEVRERCTKAADELAASEYSRGGEWEEGSYCFMTRDESEDAGSIFSANEDATKWAAQLPDGTLRSDFDTAVDAAKWLHDQGWGSAAADNPADSEADFDDSEDEDFDPTEGDSGWSPKRLHEEQIRQK